MKILLIRPWVNKNITTVKNFLFGEPLGIECVATVLIEQGHDVELVDFMIETRGKLEFYLKNFVPDFVGITSQCTDVENVLKIANITKNFDKKIKVAVGGVQATCFPNSFFVDSVDYVFKSTTRENIDKVFSRKAKEELIEGVYSKGLNFENQGHFCLNVYIMPDRSVVDKYKDKYQYMGFSPCAIIQTAYGCRNRCTFCIRWKIEGASLREADIYEIIKEIDNIEAPYIMICDNDFLINEKRLEYFCQLLEMNDINKKYICYGSVNSILEKPNTLKRLKDNGLMAVIVGYEAFDDKRLKEYNKAATISENKKATELLQNLGIACWGSVIVHPDWDKSDFKQMLKEIKNLSPELMTFSPLVPHPLTPLYEQYKERLIYTKDQYEKWNFGDVLIMPSKMTLKEYYLEVIKLAIGINLNFNSIKYSFKNIPTKNLMKVIFGFKSLFGVYIKNYFKA